MNKTIEGVAFSVASLIAMSGGTAPKMLPGTLMMIHGPWSGFSGNAKEFRRQADVLDTYAETMATIYDNVAGDGSLDMLLDGEDHYFTPEQASERGLAVVASGDPVAAPGSFSASALKSRYNIPAAFLAALKPKGGHDVADPTPAGIAPEEKTRLKNEAAKAALAADKQRRGEIRAAVTPFAGRDGVSEILDTCLDDASIQVSDATAKLLAHLGKDSGPLGGSPRINPGKTAGEKYVEGASQALLCRANIR